MSEKKEITPNKQRLIQIDENLCSLCPECVIECIGGAEAIINSKSNMTHEFFCEGLGGCAEKCPESAISFKEKEI